jgi:glycosyltransferase involved in cell wall biosynthesis
MHEMKSQNNLRIAIYSGKIPGPAFIERLVHGLAQQGVTVLLFGNRGGKADYPANVQVHYVPEGKLRMALYILLHTIQLAIKYPGDLKRLYTLVATHKGSQFRYCAKILPVLLNRPQVFHIQWAKSIKDWVWLKDIGVKIVISLRGAQINYAPLREADTAAIYRNLFPKTDAFHAVSKEIGREAEKYGAHNKPKERFEIISIGRPHWAKGFVYAVDAMAMLMKKGFNFHYTIIGGQPSEELVFHIHSLGLQHHISFVNEMPHNEVMDRMRHASLMLLPSVSEGIANVVLEAMAIGVPVLSTQCGGMEEVIEHEENGFLIPARDSRQMADAIEYIHAIPQPKLDGILQNARKTIEQQHDIRNMVNKFLDLYRSVL